MFELTPSVHHQVTSSVPRQAPPICAGDGAGATERRLTAALLRHRTRLLTMLRQTGLGNADAEDASQEAFWILARRLDTVPERAERSFLTSTALRLASDRRRSIWHGVMSEGWSLDEQDVDDDVPSDEVLAQSRARHRVDAALACLPDDERIVWLLIEREAMSRQEAAHVLNMPAGTVASRFARARARFETALREVSDAALAPSHRESPLELTYTRGNLLFHTNPWGRAKTQRRFEQRLVRRKSQGLTQWGWYWHWPGFDRSVFAYPEVMLGWKPWRGGVPTDRRLPVRIDHAGGLCVDYAVDLHAMGSYNLAISTWLSRSGGWSVAADVSDVTTEIMVWPDYSPGATPPGRYLHPFVLRGEPYELWCARHHGRRDKRDATGWTVLTLRGAGGKLRGVLPFGELLGKLAQMNLVERTHFVTCVELGNEVMGGAGTTYVERFDVGL